MYSSNYNNIASKLRMYSSNYNNIASYVVAVTVLSLYIM